MKPARSELTAAVLTVSDSSFRGTREDISGPAVRLRLQDAGFRVQELRVVPDETSAVQAALVELSGLAQLVVTTGGTGLAPRDITPEATRAVVEREIPGVAEHMRAAGLAQSRMAPLSRGVCGSRGAMLILNLPGNPDGAVASLETVLHLLPHALAVLAGETGHPQTPEVRGGMKQ